MVVSCLRLCLSVCALKGKRLEQLTTKLLHVRFHDRPTATLTLGSKVRLGYIREWMAWDLHFDTIAYVFYF